MDTCKLIAKLPIDHDHLIIELATGGPQLKNKTIHETQLTRHRRQIETTQPTYTHTTEWPRK